MPKRDPADGPWLIEVEELSANYDAYYDRIISEKTVPWFCYRAGANGRRLLLDPSDVREAWLEATTKALTDRFSHLPDTPEMNREAREFQLDFTRDVK